MKRSGNATGYDLCIRNGTVATASERFAGDIGIFDGRIVAVGTDLPKADQDVDATGLLVLPGGVDAHCHIEEPAYKGAMLADDFDSASRPSGSRPCHSASRGCKTVLSIV